MRGIALRDRIEVTVQSREQHLWSPQLTLDVEEQAKGSLLKARFGPHPHVWTMYVALYAGVVFVGLAGCVYGTSQLMLGQAPWGFWFLAVAAALGGLVWLLAFVGQGFGASQMHDLRNFVDTTLDAQEPAVDAQG